MLIKGKDSDDAHYQLLCKIAGELALQCDENETGVRREGSGALACGAEFRVAPPSD